MENIVFKYKIGQEVEIGKGTQVRRRIKELIVKDNKPSYILEDFGWAPEDYLFPYKKKKNKYNVLTWKDLDKKLDRKTGYYVASDGDIIHCDISYNDGSQDIFFDKKQAKSALAMAKISQLIEQDVYGGWTPYGESSAIIIASYDYYNGVRPVIFDDNYAEGSILRFHTKEQAELFLKNNIQLVKDYLML